MNRGDVKPNGRLRHFASQPLHALRLSPQIRPWFLIICVDANMSHHKNHQTFDLTKNWRGGWRPSTANKKTLEKENENANKETLSTLVESFFLRRELTLMNEVLQIVLTAVCLKQWKQMKIIPSFTGDSLLKIWLYKVWLIQGGSPSLRVSNYRESTVIYYVESLQLRNARTFPGYRLPVWF